MSPAFTRSDGQVWIGLAATAGRPAGVVRAVDGVISDIWLAGEKTPEALKPLSFIAGHPFPAMLDQVTLSPQMLTAVVDGSWN
jgi:hypothetical protein